MTLEELDNTLPEGLHDAQIRSYRRDFESATLTLFAKVVVGLSPENKNRLLYRDVEISFHGVQYVVSEFPGAESTFRDAGCVWFSFNRTESGTISEDLSAVLAPEILRYSLFILEWHSNIHIAAREVTFTWSS
jgi:hypothetical protein